MYYWESEIKIKSLCQHWSYVLNVECSGVCSCVHLLLLLVCLFATRGLNEQISLCVSRCSAYFNIYVYANTLHTPMKFTPIVRYYIVDEHIYTYSNFVSDTTKPERTRYSTEQQMKQPTTCTIDTLKDENFLFICYSNHLTKIRIYVKANLLAHFEYSSSIYSQPVKLWR